MAAQELPAILAAHARAAARGEPAALATVVKTAGSTYRRAGARLWIGANGESVGSISGGCLEDDARDRAREVIASGRPTMIHYDTTAEGDILWGSGVGCQGVVHVLVEPLLPIAPAAPARATTDPALQLGGGEGVIDSATAARTTATAADGPGLALDCLARGLGERWTCVLATVFRVAGSDRAAAGEFVWCAQPPAASTPGGTPAGPRMVSHIADAALAKTVGREARRALRSGLPCVRTCGLPDGGEAEIFIDVIRPPRALLILGAGHDAVPLARLAGELGWRVRVADRRRAYAAPARFPGAAEVVHCPARDIGTARLPLEAGEAVVVMTHNFLQDLAILRALLPTAAGYIGLLGPTRRKELLFRELARDPHGRDEDAPTDANRAAPEDAAASSDDPGEAAAAKPPTHPAAGSAAWLGAGSLRRVHGPAGLDIGAEAPEQIALSILAEIEAFSAGRRGGSLKRRRQPLHDVIGKSVLSPPRPVGRAGPAPRELARIDTD